MSYWTLLTLPESDVSEEEKAQGLQAEHEHLIALQQKMNQRLRDLELANEEKSSLLRAALLDRDNLSPELLELKRAETIQQMRERIDLVIRAPVEVQPKVLDTTSIEIAETVLSSEAALDKAKKVSILQFPLDKSPASAFEAAISSMRPRQQLEPSFSTSTLIAQASPETRRAEKNKSRSELSTSMAGTGQTPWWRMTALLTPKRARDSTKCSTEYFSTLTSNECPASLSLASLPWGMVIGTTILPTFLLHALMFYIL